MHLVNILWLHALSSTYLCKCLNITLTKHVYLITFVYSPHKCPDPKPRSSMCTNFAMRFSKNIHSRRLDQRLIHSRFCPVRMFHMDDDDAYFTCCEFIVSILTSNKLQCFDILFFLLRVKIVLLLGRTMVKLKCSIHSPLKKN